MKNLAEIVRLELERRVLLERVLEEVYRFFHGRRIRKFEFHAEVSKRLGRKVSWPTQMRAKEFLRKRGADFRRIEGLNYIYVYERPEGE